jgi:hypothetical protein
VVNFGGIHNTSPLVLTNRIFLTVPALTKASTFITVYCRNGIRTISAVRTTLAYTTEIAYSREYHHIVRQGYEQQLPYPAPTLYSQYNQRIVSILAAPQVSHCLRAVFGSRHHPIAALDVRDRAANPSAASLRTPRGRRQKP